MVMFLYFLGIIFFLASSGYKKNYLKKIETQKFEGIISVIIPAKDEEENISSILETVLNQNYPYEMFEVVVVNDRSVDKTQQIVESYMSKHSNLRLINIKEKSEILSGKQNALDQGIKSAKGDIVLITDADCIISKGWVRSMGRFFVDNNIGIVVGKTEIHLIKRTYLEKFQAMSHRMLMDVAQVPILFGFYTSGMGNNLAFRKKVYFEIGGYEGLGNSILDDEILVRGIAKKGYSVAAAFSKNAIVYTNPMPTWASLVKQHKRWIVGSLNIFTPSGALTFILYFLNVFTIYLLIKFVLDMIFLVQSGKPADVHSILQLDISFILKFFADTILFVKLNRAEEEKPLNVFEEIFIGLTNTFYLAFIATNAILNRKVTWKNDKVANKKSKK